MGANISDNSVDFYNTSFCGFPSFCSKDAVQACYNTTLVNCDACMPSLAYFLFVCILLLCTVIVMGNLVIMITVTKKNEKISNVDILRFSLALGDIITGQYASVIA